MVVTLTGLDMVRKKSGKMSRSNSGYAYVGGACIRNVYLKKISSVALVEDSGGYSGVLVTAHEIGHLLGSVHDGDAAPSYLRGPGAKSCSWRSGFIMSDLRRTSRGHLWSDCSTKQIKHFLKTKTASCMYNLPRHQEYSLAGPKSLVETQMSLDDQCRADQGTKACYYDQRVCTQLFCYNKKYGGCFAYRPAVEGSYCGRGKMCRNGKCITKSLEGTDNMDETNSATISKSNHVKDDTASKSSEINKIWSKRKTSSWYGVDKKRNKRQKSHTRKPKAHNEPPKNASEDSQEKCEDTFTLQGSLNCEQLFRRYAFHYCKKNKMVRKKCCRSFNTFCHL